MSFRTSTGSNGTLNYNGTLFYSNLHRVEKGSSELIGRCTDIPSLSRSSWSRVWQAFNAWREFETNEYYPQTTYFSMEEGRTLTRDAYLNWLKEMEEIHLPDRINKCEGFYSSLEEFRSEIGATDYGDTTVEIVEGLIRAARRTKETIMGVLDACSQFRSAAIEEDNRESEESYTLLVNREEEIRRLITVISEGLNKVDELLTSHENG